MLGAIVGDVIGSVYEHRRRLPRASALFAPGSRFTDDTLFTLATADALLAPRPVVEAFRHWGRRYPGVGASPRFGAWLASDDPRPYGGDTNGALMRVSPAVALALDEGQARATACMVTAVSHDHPDALAAVDAYARALWAALEGAPAGDVLAAMALGEPGPGLDELHAAGAFRCGALQTLADARSCLAAAASFEDAMRNAIYCGGDVDTLCTVAGAVAEALWGVPEDFVDSALALLPAELRALAERAGRAGAANATARRLRSRPRA